MSRIQQVNSAPEYITNFISGNSEKLNEIYEEGIQIHSSGCMMFLCSEETNKMDVQFMNDDMMCEILERDSWFQVKNNIPADKKLFFIKDEGLSAVFMVYI